MICGRRFSFITIASIDFWSDLQLFFFLFFFFFFLHLNACILPSIICHTVVFAVWYGVLFLMVWPWFGHSSLNHNEYAVSSAVSRMKMPPVREHASSLVFLSNFTSGWHQLTPARPLTPSMHYTLVWGPFYQIWWPQGIFKEFDMRLTPAWPLIPAMS